MQPDVTPFFTIATTSSGSPSIAIKFWKEHCASGYEPSFGRFARNWGYRSSRAFCPKSISTCSSRYHRISRSATSFAVSKGAHRIAFRWSSQNFANVTGVAISGRGATSAPPAATSQTRRYFSISSIMNLPASAGSYSVETLHLSFASSKRLMRILGSIVGTQSLLVQPREANFAKRRSVGSEFVGDDNLRNEALPPKQF